MKMRTIPNLYRNVKRWHKLVGVLSRYGLADWLIRLNVSFFKDHLKDRDGEALSRHSREARIRMALTDLGPTFIKMGQLLSTRPDLVGNLLADELKRLQNDVPADPPDVVRATLTAELGQPIEDLFSEFDDVPVASASIGQVHRARLHAGGDVVVKVRHAAIESIIRDDLEVLSGVAALAEQIDEFKPFRPLATVAELSRGLLRELDFGREERNLQQFAALFSHDSKVHIPRPFTDFCTARVLTMEWLDGVKLDAVDGVPNSAFDLEQIVRHGAELYLEMIFTHGLYHADPHPGNLLLLPGNVLGLLDFGMVGRLDERLREEIELMLMALIQRDVRLLTSIIRRVGSIPPYLDDAVLASDMSDFVDHYTTQSLEQFDLGGALSEMMDIVYRHQITLPAQIPMLIKTLVSLEGTTKLLHPEFSIIELMKPFHRKMLLRRMSPARQVQKMRRLYMEIEHLAEVLPGRLLDIVDQVQKGKFDVHLDHRGLGPSVNRLVLGMLASSLFLGGAMMLSHEVPPVLFPENTWFGLTKVSLLGIVACVISTLLGLRFIQAIRKSDQLDRRE
ncbi:MAG: ABC transporter [Planctomycetaceae bacterium]|nr:ABC transporter [Planctomycetaceae bacterium]